jgi:hypothetical protein
MSESTVPPPVMPTTVFLVCACNIGPAAYTRPMCYALTREEGDRWAIANQIGGYSVTELRPAAKVVRDGWGGVREETESERTARLRTKWLPSREATVRVRDETGEIFGEQG